MKRRIISLLLTALVAAMCLPFGQAAGTAQIKIDFPKAGAGFEAYYVADSSAALATDFTGAAIDLKGISTAADTANAAAALDRFAQTKGLTGTAFESTLSGLDAGYYLLVQKTSVSGYTTMLPTLVKLAEGQTVAVDPKVTTTGGGGGGGSTIKIQVSKVWVDQDNADNLRPDSITVKLLSSGTVVRTVTLTSAMNWQYTFTGLSSGGKYTVEEDAVSGYTVSYAGDKSKGFTITNTHETTTTKPTDGSLTVTKQWSDNNSPLRPKSITVQLTQGGTVITTAVLSADNGWNTTFTGLEAGKSYNVKEIAVAGYTATYSKVAGGVVILNTAKKTENGGSGSGSSGSGSTGGSGGSGSGWSGGTKIPQTGQLMWPVPVLAGTGALCILLGLISNKKSRKKQNKA